MAPEDVHKTSFVTPDGQYDFLQMLFCMVNSGATLVRRFQKNCSEPVAVLTIYIYVQRQLGGTSQNAERVIRQADES